MPFDTQVPSEGAWPLLPLDVVRLTHSALLEPSVTSHLSPQVSQDEPTEQQLQTWMKRKAKWGEGCQMTRPFRNRKLDALSEHFQIELHVDSSFFAERLVVYSKADFKQSVARNVVWDKLVHEARAEDAVAYGWVVWAGASQRPDALQQAWSEHKRCRKEKTRIVVELN